MLHEANYPRLLTIPEAADFLRCSRSHISNALNGKLTSTPRLPCVRIGRRVLFRRDALEAWVQEVERLDNTLEKIAR
jgi:excisionase family DNA binding protein